MARYDVFPFVYLNNLFNKAHCGAKHRPKDAVNKQCEFAVIEQWITLYIIHPNDVLKRER